MKKMLDEMVNKTCEVLGRLIAIAIMVIGFCLSFAGMVWAIRLLVNVVG